MTLNTSIRPRTDDDRFSNHLKAWAGRMGYTRDQGSAALCVPRPTYDGWCDGRPPALENTVRKLMTLIEARS